MSAAAAVGVFHIPSYGECAAYVARLRRRRRSEVRVYERLWQYDELVRWAGARRITQRWFPGRRGGDVGEGYRRGRRRVWVRGMWVKLRDVYIVCSGV